MKDPEIVARAMAQPTILPAELTVIESYILSANDLNLSIPQYSLEKSL
jgi:hypothetical protein